MSQTKAHPDHKQGSGSAASSAQQSTAAAYTASVPGTGSHTHSHAAHLQGGSERTQPAMNLFQGATPGTLRQPASIPQRNGKQHR